MDKLRTCGPRKRLASEGLIHFYYCGVNDDELALFLLVLTSTANETQHARPSIINGISISMGKTRATRNGGYHSRK